MRPLIFAALFLGGLGIGGLIAHQQRLGRIEDRMAALTSLRQQVENERGELDAILAQTKVRP